MRIEEDVKADCWDARTAIPSEVAAMAERARVSGR
jgi:hypothetical protein